jgi:hypothetical protein
MESMADSYRVLVEKHEGNISFGRSARRWKDSIKMDVNKIKRENVLFIWLMLGSSGGLL